MDQINSALFLLIFVQGGGDGLQVGSVSDINHSRQTGNGAGPIHAVAMETGREELGH